MIKYSVIGGIFGAAFINLLFYGVSFVITGIKKKNYFDTTKGVLMIFGAVIILELAAWIVWFIL